MHNHSLSSLMAVIFISDIKNIFLIIIIFFSGFAGFSQNLVSNPGFEEFIPPAFDGKQGTWKKCLYSDTPDYFYGPEAKKVFDKYVGGTVPHSGNSYIGIFVYRTRQGKKNEIREFVQSSLIEPLKQDSIYDVTAFVLTDPESNIATDGFGIYLTETLLTGKKSADIYCYKPQVINKSGYFLKDQYQWMKVSGRVRATGREKIIVIGNFKPDKFNCLQKIENSEKNTNKKKKWYLRNGEDVSYLYIDDVSVYANDSMNKNDILFKMPLKGPCLISVIQETGLVLRTFPNPEKNEENSLSKDPGNTGVFNDPVVSEGQVFNLHHVLFEFAKDIFLSSSVIELNELLRFLRANPGINIEIRGHTDSLGTTEHNIELSIARAKAVEKFLIKNDIVKNRMECYGYGSSVPVATNQTEAGRKLNRRVEIIITKKQ
ncbi:MAG: OmpA family protein [Bacteroidia bacterium]|nr:OmpA family protein [Bacteroidia bacterium]